MAKKKMTIEDLAIMTNRGFESVTDVVNKRFEQVDSRGDMEEVKRHFVYRHEFEDALSRIHHLEKKPGIKSGKNHH